MLFQKNGNALTARHGGETLRIEGWGKDAFRVTAYMDDRGSGCDWALTETPKAAECEIIIGEEDFWVGDGTISKVPCAEIRNGRISATVNFAGVISFFRDGKLILREYYRSYGGTIVKTSRCLKLVNREWKGNIGGSEYALTVRFDANRDEKIFGMGQYQQEDLNLKGTMLELAQRNSQISVPFMVSSLGYGFLWNNPAVGRVTFANNMTEWIARSTKQMDYWICAGEDPKDILRKYTEATGRAPMFPDNLMGLWQCKLRYRTQEEVLMVARQYQKEASGSTRS